MDFEDKGVRAFLFWLKYTLIAAVAFVVVGMVLSWFKLSIPYGLLIMDFYPALIISIWVLWSITWVPLRHFVWGYRFSIDQCPSCKASWVNEECPNCKGTKFLGDQCLVCGQDMSTRDKCEDCGAGNLKTFASNKD